MTVTCEVEDRIATVTLSDPATHNALDEAGVRGLGEAWARIRDDDEILVAVLRGDGDRAFSSGANLKTLLPILTDGGLPEIVAPDGPVFAKFVLPKPVVAAVRGICVAGGTELLQATDIRIASHDAVFGLPEPRWGLLPVGGSTVRLARQIPYCHAMEMLLTGELIDAETALRIGLVNRLVDSAEVDGQAREVARKITRNGPVAVQAIKRAVLESWGLPLGDAFAVESAAGRRVFASVDAVEGPLAFTEKRAPRFEGR